MESNPVFANLHHIGVLVRDLEKAIRYYQSLGIGPFEPRDTSGLTEKTMYGKPSDFQLKIATAQMGPVMFELIQPMGNAPLMEEFLKTNGEGITHIAFATDNLNREVAPFTKKGVKAVLTTKTPTGRAAYLDTREVGGVIIEFVQW